MGGYLKKGLWWLLIGCILVAVFRGVGSVDNIYPWLVKESHQFQNFITHLTTKFPTQHLKPLKSIIPKVIPSPKATH